MKAVSYLRQSTQKQERSGLGIEAQRKVVADYVALKGLELETEFIETESGRRSDRPKLLEALTQCRLTGAKLLISKLDRLARNASFLLSLRDSGVDFVACDFPDANRLTVGIIALLAEQEADLISQRTRDALQAKKRKCERDGVPFFEGQKANARKVHAQSIQAIKRKASERVSERRGVILDVFNGSGGSKYLRTSKILNDLRVPTLTGKGKWTATSVRRVIKSKAPH